MGRLLLFRLPAKMLRRADLLTALGFIAFCAAILAAVIFRETTFGSHIKETAPAAESFIIMAALLAALGMNARALILRGQYDDYSREPWDDFSLFIINCGISLTSLLGMLTLALGLLDLK